MKTYIKNLFLLPVLIACLGLLPAGRATAQTFTTLHSFTTVSTNSSGIYTNSDGGGPTSGLILSGNTLYGTTSGAGSLGFGTVFRVNTDGTRFTNLYNFAGYPSDGANPVAGLILSGNTLYGTTSLAIDDGSSFNGTVFKVNTDGTDYTNLHKFAGPSDGAYPFSVLILSGNALYGTTDSGGGAGFGTVFKVNTDGTGYTNLFSFIAGSTNSSGVYTNSDGSDPDGNLILSGGTLYGTASNGGTNAFGTVFKVNTNGTGFTTLHSFTGRSAPSYSPYMWGELMLSGNALYGTAAFGGNSDAGTVFAVNTDGTSFTTLYSFTATSGSPYGNLTISGNTLYGTAVLGGTNGAGTVFSITLPQPQLTINRSAANVVLIWPTNTAGLTFTLQSTTNLVSPAGWNIVSPVSAVVSGQNTVTNPISGTQQFYRLSQ